MKPDIHQSPLVENLETVRLLQFSVWHLNAIGNIRLTSQYLDTVTFHQKRERISHPPIPRKNDTPKILRIAPVADTVVGWRSGLPLRCKR